MHVPFELLVELVRHHAPEQHGHGRLVRLDDVLFRRLPDVKRRLVPSNDPAEDTVPLHDDLALGLKVNTDEQVGQRRHLGPGHLRRRIVDVKLNGFLQVGINKSKKGEGEGATTETYQDVSLVGRLDDHGGLFGVDPAGVPGVVVEPGGFNGVDLNGNIN